jgi:hypothetical protein
LGWLPVGARLESASGTFAPVRFTNLPVAHRWWRSKDWGALRVLCSVPKEGDFAAGGALRMWFDARVRPRRAFRVGFS